MLYRINDKRKVAFGKQLKDHGVILDWLAKSRMEIDAARLVVLNAAIKIDDFGAKKAVTEVAEAKVLVPKMALKVVDRVIQSFGAAGVSQDTPLANMWAQIRTLRFADGPDEAHLSQLGRNENKKGADATLRITKQERKTQDLMTQYNLKSDLSGPQSKL